jgi:hypothetical protein
MIISKTFGGVVLSGEDASKFERQVKYGRGNGRAQEALNRGDELLRQHGEGKLGDTAASDSRLSKGA